MASLPTQFARSLFALLALLATLTLALAACGGGDSGGVPADAIAVVGDDEVPKEDFDGLLARAQKSYENQKREFPKAGTPEYQDLKTRAVSFLVQRYRFLQEAEERGIEVSDEDVQARLDQIKKDNFEDDQKKFDEALEREGLTVEDAKEEVRYQLLQEKLFEDVTNDIEATDEEIQKYYDENKSQFTQPATRDVRHIVVKSKAKADALRAQLEDGADFAKLARANSTDKGSAKTGGKIPVQKGSTVPPFDKAAFELDTNEISQPIKTTFGWHIIMPISDVKAEKVQELDEIRDSIAQQLTEERKNKAVEAFLKELEEKFPAEYAAGYEPPPATLPTETGGTAPADTSGATDGGSTEPADTSTTPTDTGK
jgi:parvulin-like peptidyl-prolyl isomerase